MSGLIVQNSLEINTNHGKCCIELCLGDITKLPHSQAVDVVLVSAVHGSYSPAPGTLLGALKKNLNIDVNAMAKNKGEDLRNMYNCWVSLALPDHLPFKRLLCFETKLCSGQRPKELVGNIFRCLVPVLSNGNEGSVITPLLSTGCQGYGEVSMLQSLTETVINWIKAGLPLKLFKIVLFADIENGEVTTSYMRTHEELCCKFAEIKEEHIKNSEEYDKEVPTDYDVYLSCSEEDSDIASTFESELRASRPDIKVFTENQTLDRESAWQSGIYETMLKSARVVPILTPNFLQSISCLEQYHLALCCNRRTRRQMLAPFYVASVKDLPTYIGLVQYIDCRENDRAKISRHCSELAKTLPIRKPDSLFAVPIQYDVFVSYSHRDSEQAHEIVKILQNLNQDLRIFFDVQELKTGTSWQRTLYHAIDASRCLMAVMSKTYLSSAVCQEEYNLALAKHCSDTVDFRLVPVYIDEDIGLVPNEFNGIQVVHAPKASFTHVMQQVSTNILNEAISPQGAHSNERSVKKNIINIEHLRIQIRRERFVAKFGSKTQLISDDVVFPPHLSQILPVSEPSKEKSCKRPDIMISFAKEEGTLAQYLAWLLQESAPHLMIIAEMKTGRERLVMVENSNRVVTFLSPAYIENPQLVEEFHSALWRQRINLFPILFAVKCSPLPPLPTYFQVVPHYVDTTDTLWTEVTNKYGLCLPGDTPFSTQHRSLSREVALSLRVTAAFLLESIRNQRETGESTRPPKPALLNVMRLSDELQND